MIYGERIRLRHIEREDLPLFVEWMNDPEVRRGISRYLPISTVEEENWFERVMSADQDERPLVIEAREGDGYRTIGNCGFFRIDWRNRNAELGIMIGVKSLWNQGYGTEVMRLLLKHGFQTLNLHRIYLRVFDFNQRAVRAYEKAGFKLDGRMRESDFRDGKYVDTLYMSVLRHEWVE